MAPIKGRKTVKKALKPVKTIKAANTKRASAKTNSKPTEFKYRRIALEESILAQKVNLACANGHAHFSPTPMSWVDKECGIKKRTGGRCKKPLFFIRSSREIPEPRPPRKPSKLNKLKRT